MNKTNSFVKYLKNISNFINSLLEKNLNKLNSKNLYFLIKNNKIILIFVALVVIFVSYLSIPTFYNETNILKRLKNEFNSKFDIDIKFSNNIKYNLFPRPHFAIANSVIIDKDIEISNIRSIKIYLTLDNLFSLKNIKFNDLIFQNANFNLNQKNYKFFLNLLKKKIFKDRNLKIEDSNIFFRNSVDEVLFVNKILKFEYYYEPKELKNIFYAESEIFNIPYSMKTFFNEDESIIFSQLNLMKFEIENELSLNNEKKIGNSELVFNKSKQILEYQIEKNFIEFQIFDKIDQPNKTYKGKFNFKPFFATFEGAVDEINLNYLFESNAIIAELLKTEIFNNKNIDFQLNINADKVYKNLNLKNINLSSRIQEGLIDSDKTTFEWRNFANFELSESLIFVKNGELVLDGKLKININDYNKVYTFLLTPKNYRSEINIIDLNFTYNFDQKIAELKDIRIDNKINQNVNKILNNVILKKDDLQNKIYFKNLLNQAIKSYAG